MHFLRTTLLASIALLAAILIGCREDDAINKDTVTFPDRELIYKHIAIFEREDMVWFFLLSGPEAEVKKQIPAFDEFVRSTRFDPIKEKDPDKQDSPLIWKEPKEWRKDPGTGSFLRYAGFRIDAKPRAMEVTVTRMPAKGYSLLANINRWEKQVNLPTSEALNPIGPGVKVTREKVADQAVTWVDLKGLTVHTVSRPPEPMALKGKNLMPPLQFKKQARGRGKPFKYEAPEGWRKQEIPPGKLAVDMYLIGAGANAAKLTLTPLGGSVGGNISRWRDEIQLPRLANDEDAAATAVKLKVAGIDSYYADIANPGGPPASNRTLGVIIPMGQTSWFIKMWGPHDLVGQHKNEFETFVKSFQLDAR